MKPFKVKRKRVINGKTTYVPSISYYGKIKDGVGKWKIVKLFQNKEASIHELNRLSRNAEQVRAGMIEPTISQGLNTPLSVHIDAFCESIDQNRRKSKSQWSKEQKAKLRRVFEQAKAITPKDITLDKIKGAIERLNKKNNWSKQTRNFYIRTIKAFFGWLLKEGRIGYNPVQNLQVSKIYDGDIKRPRRAFTLAECRYLVSFVANLRDSRKVINPPKTRALLYSLAFQSGLRAKELFSLKPTHFDMAKGFVTILGKDAKNASTEFIPLPLALMEQIKEHTAGLDKSKPIFKGVYYTSLAGKRLKKDMALARKAYIQQSRSPDEKEARSNDDFLLWENHLGEFLDFHSLRSGFVTNLLEQGANIKQVQVLARHKDAETTLKHYAKSSRQDLVKVVAGMPALLPYVATSTGDQKGDHGDQKGDQTNDISGCPSILTDTQNENTITTQNELMQILSAYLDGRKEVRPVGIEPTTLDLGNRCSIP